VYDRFGSSPWRYPAIFLRIALGFFASFVVLSNVHAQPHANPRTDSLGDPLPDGAIARLGTLRFKHNVGGAIQGLFKGLKGVPSSQIESTVFSPDGRKIASQAALGNIRLWDAATGKDLPGPWNSNDPFRAYSAIAFSPDSGILAAIGMDRRGPTSWEITLWDVATTKEVRRLDNQPQIKLPQESMVFSPGGKTLILAGIGGVRWWDAATGKEQRAWLPFDAKQETGIKPDGKDKLDDKETIINYKYLLSPKGKYLAVHVRSLRFDRLNAGPTEVLQNEAIGFDLATPKSAGASKATRINA
jgi:WD40 repeat protein